MKEMIPEKITAILRGYEGRELERIVDALVAGGIKAVEVTMNSPSAGKSISDLRSRYGNRVSVGAGTVTTLERFHEAAKAGAQFMITPNVDEEIIRASHERGIMILPGAFTPSEIVKAYALGCRYIKLFPAVSVGPEYIKALKAPLDDVNIIAVGGINTKNVSDYIRSGAYGVGVGGGLCRTPEDGDYMKITQEAEKLVGFVCGEKDVRC